MEHDLNIMWNFFATSHKKGVVDRNGGTVSRAVWRHVKSKRAQVTNASEYSSLGKWLFMLTALITINLEKSLLWDPNPGPSSPSRTYA